jgi:ABC-type uncharacterized transport system involved in gliding motility auxiliary subunit
MAVSDKKRSTLLATAAILVALVAANTAAWFALRGLRLDVTEERLHTLSPGVRDVLASLPEPVRIDLYWTREAGADLPSIRSHAQRVEEFLEEVEAAAGGNLELRVIDPEPFSEAEDAAKAAGIAPRPLDATGRALMLGLAVRGPTDRTETIGFLDPVDEPFLEYELARRILSVGRAERPRIALLSTIPEERPFDPRNPMASAARSILLQQLDQLFEVVRVDRDAPEVPGDAKALVLVQPRKLPDAALRAIDAWAVAGRPLVVFADPWCESDPDARTLDFGKTGAGTSLDLGPLLASWGVAIDPDNVVGDLGYATRVQYRTAGGQVMEMSHPAWLSTTRAAYAVDDPVVAPLSAINLKGAGAVRRLEGATTSVAPVITSTKDVQMIQNLKLGFFGEIDRLVRDFAPLGEPVDLAVRISGPFESAYPAEDGSRAKGEADILLVADADMLSDETWVQVDPRLGVARMIADNGQFVLNALEQASGDRLLSGLRSRGRYQRPFGRVEEIRKDAEARYLRREQELEDEIRKGEMRINELQRARGDEGVDALGRIVLTPEQEEEIDRIEAASRDARKELREVQRSLRADIERTGTALMALNVVAWPLAVAGLATAVISVRHRRQKVK